MTNPTAPTLDVLAIGNAIVDVLAPSEDAVLNDLGVAKGGMTLIDDKQADAFYTRMAAGVEMSGGSAGNTIFGIASLGGKAGYVGKVANDQLGTVFRHDMHATGVVFDTPALPADTGVPTARCLIFVTPDAQRTMCTYLGACVHIAPEDLDAAQISSAQVTYLEGYLFDRDSAKATFRAAAAMAHSAGRKIALTLSDSFCVDRHRDDFVDLVENHVDILFANEAEITSLYQVKTVEDALPRLKSACDIAAITLGEKGAVIISGNEAVHVPAEKIENLLDTTGAGDAFAAGFLFGYTQNWALAECGALGNRMAAAVLSTMGARAQIDVKTLLTRKAA